MVNISRILCPVDFSGCAQRALHYAVGMGHWYGASVTALHVYANRPVIDPIPVYGGQPLVLKDQDPATIRAELDALIASSKPACPVEGEIVEAADTPDAIVRHARGNGADLIVTHGRAGLERLILGSVAEKVVQNAGCPVMLVPPDVARKELPPRVPFSRIVCALDFAATSRRAFDWALELAEEADAHLTLLHAIEVPPELQVPMGRDEVDVAATRATAEAEALQQLRELVPAEAHTYCKVHTDVREGRADCAIVDTAVAREADLIVIGVQRHHALDRLVFGSTTHTVLRSAPCPVLAVPGVTMKSRLEVA